MQKQKLQRTAIMGKIFKPCFSDYRKTFNSIDSSDKDQDCLYIAIPLIENWLVALV